MFWKLALTGAWCRRQRQQSVSAFAHIMDPRSSHFGTPGDKINVHAELFTARSSIVCDFFRCIFLFPFYKQCGRVICHVLMHHVTTLTTWQESRSASMKRPKAARWHGIVDRAAGLLRW